MAWAHKLEANRYTRTRELVVGFPASDPRRIYLDVDDDL
jgi:hypothetical protein